jgi:SAM-dependent methyltransferase
MLGFHAVYLIDAGGRLGFFEALRQLGGVAQPAALAAELAYGERMTQVWCQAACGVGVLSYQPSAGYRFADGMDEVLGEAGGDLPSAHLLAEIARDFAELPEAYRDGGAGGDGARRRFSDHAAEFYAFQSRVAALRSPLVADYLLGLPGLSERLRDGGAALDIGSGAGGLLLALTERAPSLRATGVEPLPYFVERSREAIQAAGVGDRAQVEAVPAETMEFVEEFDVVTQVQVFHELPHAKKPAILRACRRALRNDGFLVLIDRCLPGSEEEIGDRRFTMSVLEQWFEVSWGNVVHTRAEILQMLDDAGFSVAVEDEKAVPTYWTFVARPR